MSEDERDDERKTPHALTRPEEQPEHPIGNDQERQDKRQQPHKHGPGWLKDAWVALPVFNKLTLGVEIISAVAVIFYCGFAALQWCALRETNAINRDAVAEMRQANSTSATAVSYTGESLKLATRQLSLGEDARRARIALELTIGGGEFSVKPGGGGPAFMISTSITAVNKGSLDARAVQVLFGCVWYSVTEPSIDICGRMATEKITLSPGASRRFSLALTQKRAAQTLAGILPGASPWVLFRIRYEDSIGGIRQTDGCWHTDQDMTLIPSLNVATDKCVGGTCLDSKEQKR